jgi:glutamate dehydrogenase (NAD(P)+)
MVETVSIAQALRNYSAQVPEQVVHWQDPLSAATGVLVIQSMKQGACGGGTRVSTQLDVAEVSMLAKVMQLKFALVGPAIGGAKSCVCIPADEPNPTGVLQRWFVAMDPYLRAGYGTAADANTDFATITQLLQNQGITHPQQGILTALAKGDATQAMLQRLACLQQPVVLASGVSVPLAELVTGYMLAKSVEAVYREKDISIVGQRAYVQGTGTVGAAVAYYLQQMGVHVIALCDKTHAIYAQGGVHTEALLRLVKTHAIHACFDTACSHTQLHQQLFTHGFDIFIPATGAHLVDADFMHAACAQGLSVMASGANIPFSEGGLYGSLAQWVDQRISFVPGFIASSGMARAFSFLMQAQQDACTAEAIFQDAAQTISCIIHRAWQENAECGLAAACYAMALQLAV